MPLKKLQNITEYVMYIVFGVSQLALILALVNYTSWGYPSQEVFYAYQSLIITAFMSTSCVVAAYSFVFYYQESNIRNYILGVTSIALVPTSFIFLVGYPGFPIPNFIEPHAFKVQLMLIILGLIIGSGLFFCSILNYYSKPKLREKVFLVIMDFCLPILAIAISLIPNSVMDQILSSSILHAFAWGIEFLLLGLILTALYRFAKNWKLRSNSIPTGIILFLVCFLMCLLILALPYGWGHISEIVVMAEVFLGYALIAMGLTATTITDPHRGLSSIIREKTTELERSRSESDFYLNIWGHELGNTLQGVISYLELIRMKKDEKSSAEMESIALELAQRATRIVREVSELALIKQEQVVLHSIDVIETISETVSYMQEEMKLKFKANISIPTTPVKVQADSLFGQIFIHLFRVIIDRSPSTPEIFIKISLDREDVVIQVTDSSRTLPDSAVDFLMNRITATEGSINLGLFIIKNLVDRYHGEILYNQSNGKNHLSIILKNDRTKRGLNF
ncbi:MAG: hypothetical protein GF411_00515 [Candidatus Lokiarchaeota archaeon]|nr:hypothetical protein [Candidatus Lokiarchaeota archaeon]